MPASPQSPPEPSALDSLWIAPLVPVAMALTAGVVLDRLLIVSFFFSFAAAIACGFAWLIHRRGRFQALGLAYLFLAVAFAGAAYHHLRFHGRGDDPLSGVVGEEPRLARLYGQVASEPRVTPPVQDDLRSFAATSSTRIVVDASHIKSKGTWQEFEATVLVLAEGMRRDLHVGDWVEVVGLLGRPLRPGNPGEPGFDQFLRDQGIVGVLSQVDAQQGIVLRERGWPTSFRGWMGEVRTWWSDVLDRHIAPERRGLAKALLLGDDAELTSAGWDKYIRTGVVHVLVVSGQHLSILAMFLWQLRRLGRFSYRGSAAALGILLFAYALMTGAQPPVMRAAWIAVVVCGGIGLGRVVLPASAFALAWIGVIVAQPMDIFNMGCQISFLASGLLLWGLPRGAVTGFMAWFPDRPRDDEALASLVEESRSPWTRMLRRAGRFIFQIYAVNLFLWLIITPLVVGSQNLIAPVALLIGPPMVLMTSAALVFGFLLFLTAPFGLAALFALPTTWCLNACDAVVDGAMNLSSGFYVPDLPAWWLLVFYLLVVSWLILPVVARWTRVVAPLALGWLVLGLFLVLGPRTTADSRCAFLAVGHGGCVVLESESGKVAVYDAGAMAGPDVTRRHIAPYLWHRGIRRIDELLVSHADLDHFNGVVTLLDRFDVRQVTVTPSFQERVTPGVSRTLRAFRRHGLTARVVQRGDAWRMDEWRFTVLHPPHEGPAGNENARSLVLDVRTEGLSVLLTGDLEGPGLVELLALPPRRIDVLQAPHHGSKGSNTPALAFWATPRLVVSSQGKPRSLYRAAGVYEPDAPFWTTWIDGAVTLRREDGRWRAESFRNARVRHLD